MAGLAEIARAAGVSVSTVSRVLNGRAGVNEETRRRVLSVVAEMPYTARGLGALQRTGVIALLVPELSNPVFPAFAEALEVRASRAGYACLLCNTRAGTRRPDGDVLGRAMGEEEYVRMLLARGVAGMVFVSPEISNPSSDRPPRHYRTLLDEGVPTVFVNGGAPTLDVPDFAVDEQLAGYLATRHLVELGHERIGFVCGPARSLPARLKRVGWQTALEEAGLPTPAELVAHAPFGPEGGAAALAELLDRPDPRHRPTGVICSSDHMALGVLREARRRGLDVPGRLSVVGFDDIPLAACCAPALTTLAQPIEEMAAAAIDELVRRLVPGTAQGGGSRGHSTLFRPRLVVRESTAPPG